MAVEALKADGRARCRAAGDGAADRCGRARWCPGGAASSVLGDNSPMVSVTNADPDRIAELLDEFAQDVRTVLPPVLSIRNGRRSVVITGTPEQLARFELYCSKITEKEEAERKNKIRGGAVFAPGVRRGPGRGRLPHPAAGRRHRHRRRLGREGRHRRRTGPRDGRGHPGPARSTGSTRSSACTTPAPAGSSTWAPATSVTRLTAPVIRGLGVGIVPAATRGGPAQPVHRRRRARGGSGRGRATRRRWSRCPTARSSSRPSSPG